MTMPFGDGTIAVEWYADGTWHDLLPDIISGSFRATHGDMGTGIADRVAKKGTVTFKLNNSESNSAKKIGYYTPTHTNVISAFWGRPYDYPLRITFTYEGRVKVFRYTFEPGPQGVKVEAGTKGSRQVTVNFRDYIGILQEYKLDLLPAAASKRSDEAMQLVIDALPANRQPQKTLFRTGDSTFETVFDDTNSGTTGYAETVKIAMSELGYIYNRADRTNGETLVLDNRLRRYQQATTGNVTGAGASPSGDLLLESGDVLLLETGDDLLLDATTIIATAVSMSNAESGNILLETGDALLLEDGDNLLYNDTQSADFDNLDLISGRGMDVSHYDLNYQSARLSIQQKDVGTSTVVLYAMALPLYIGAGETLTGIRGRFRDPSGGQSYVNGTDFVTPVAGTDFGAWANKNGTGTDLKANISVTANTGSAEVEYSITNSGAAAWITNPNLQQRGAVVNSYDSLDIVLGDNVSEKRLDMNLNYETDESVGRQFVNEIIKNPIGVTTIQKIPLQANRDTFNLNAWMDLDIGSMINVTEDMTHTDYNNPYFINGYEWELFKAGNGVDVYWYPNGFPYSRVFVPAS